MKAQASSGDPLSRIALDAPSWVAPTLSIGGRLAGTAIALYIANDQAYDRTQAVAVAVAVAVLLSALPLRGGVAAGIIGAAAGLLFFSGAALGKEVPAAGLAMVATGVAAEAGALMSSRRDGRTAIVALGGFFAALPLLILCVAAIALLIDG
jgi:hypothetical protein